MIIVKISGRLGNQLFQYALGKRLSITHKTQLKLDLSQFKEQNNIFYLKKFRTKIIKADEKEINKIVNINFINKLHKVPENFQKFFFKIIKICYPNFVYEKKFNFDQNVLISPDNIYLTGYWQSEKYFTNSANIIRKEFELRIKLSNNSLSTLKEIKKSNSISIHFRRGDYSFIKDVNKKHGLLQLDYYRHAVDYITKKIKKPLFFIFSDDIEWVKKNFFLDQSIRYIDFNNQQRVCDDFILMKNCMHNIIANSTFSWWAAWLNSYKNKIVIAPKKWFNDKSINTTDLLPDSWIKL